MEVGKKKTHFEDSYEQEQRHRSGENIPPKATNRGGIASEWSTLIARFSYSSDVPKTPERTYGLKQEGSDTEEFRRAITHKKSNKKNEPMDNNFSNKYQKTVNRKTQDRDLQHLNTHFQPTLYKSEFSEDDNLSSLERKNKSHNSLKKYHRSRPRKVEKQSEYYKRVRVTSSGSQQWSPKKMAIRARSKPRSRSGSERRSQQGLPKKMPIRARSKPRSRSGSEFRSPSRDRCQPLNSRVKDMPIKYQPRKISKKCKYVERKSEVSLKRPTIINLSPINTIEKYEVCSSERPFLENDLPCKCCKCKRKYEQLIASKPQKLRKNTNIDSNHVPQRNRASLHLEEENKVPSKFHRYDMSEIEYTTDYNGGKCCKQENVGKYCKLGNVGKYCNQENVDKYCKEDVHICKNEDANLNSFYIPFDSAVAEYFYSILAEINYC